MLSASLSSFGSCPKVVRERRIPSNPEHPPGRAVVRFAEQNNIPTSQPVHFEYRVGRGVSALVQGEQTIAGNRTLFVELSLTVPECAAA